MSVIGIDCGLHGAMADYDHETNTLLDITDIPAFNMVIKKKTRRRVDAVALINYFETRKMMGAKMVVIEAVGGRPKQSASAGFVLGYIVGLVYMACIAVRIPIETTPPQTWKKVMRVPGKYKSGTLIPDAEDMVISRADELMPEARDLWRGPKGGRRVDRAEAAILAKYGAEHLLRIQKPNMLRHETLMVYKNAETGA